MTVNIRPLYAKVGIMRPDVSKAHLGFCIREAHRLLAADTLLAREVVTQLVTAGVNNYTVVLSVPTHDLLRVHRVQVKGLLDANPTELSPMPNPTMVYGDTLETSTGRPRYYMQQGGTLFIYPIPDTADTYTLTIKASWAPQPGNDDDTTGLPHEAYQALELLAESLALKIPGQYQDKKMAMVQEQGYQRRLGRLRSVAALGETATPVVIADKVAGTR